MKYRSEIASVVLIASAIAATAYLWLVDRGKVSDVERAERAADVFPAFRRQEVTRVVLARGDEQLVLERTAATDAAGASWAMRAPRDEPAETGAVDALLTELESARRVRSVDGREGLDHPRVTGSIAMGKLTFAFALGGGAPTPAGATYMRVEGEGAFVVGPALVDALTKPADSFRIRQLAPYGVGDARRVEVRGPATTFAIERAASGDFLVASSGLRVARAVVDRLTTAIGEARADAFVAGDSPPGASTVITLDPIDSSRPRFELAVGGACPSDPNDVVAVRTSPAPRVVACVAKGVADALSEGAAPDARLFYATADDVAELSIATLPSGSALDLARAGNGWHERLPEDRTLNDEEADAASAFVAGVVGAAGEVRGKGELAGAPRLRVTVVRAQDRATEVVDVAIAADGTATARRGEDGALVTLSADVARALLPRATALRSFTLFDAAVRGAEIRSIATRCGPVAQELTRSDAGWAMRSPAGYAPDVARALDLVEAVEHAKAIGWATDDAAFGAGEAPCSVAVVVGQDGATRTLGVAFGRDAPGGVYARVQGEASVFIAPASLRDVATHWMIDRSGFAIDVGRVAGVDVDAHGHHASLARRGGKLTRADAGEDALADAVGEITAADVAHLGPAAADEGLASPALVIKVHGGGDAAADRTLSFGASRGSPAQTFARVSGVDATFVVDTRVVDRIVDAL